MDKDKWKTFPCKECLIKKTCKQECFEWPDGDTAIDHITTNNLQGVCLLCGDEIARPHSWVCSNCLMKTECITEYKIC